MIINQSQNNRRVLILATEFNNQLPKTVIPFGNHRTGTRNAPIQQEPKSGGRSIRCNDVAVFLPADSALSYDGNGNIDVHKGPSMFPKFETVKRIVAKTRLSQSVVRFLNDGERFYFDPTTEDIKCFGEPVTNEIQADKCEILGESIVLVFRKKTDFLLAIKVRDGVNFDGAELLWLETALSPYQLRPSGAFQHYAADAPVALKKDQPARPGKPRTRKSNFFKKEAGPSEGKAEFNGGKKNNKAKTRGSNNRVSSGR